MKIGFKFPCGREEVVQLGDGIWGFGHHADGQKVIVVNLGFLMHKTESSSAVERTRRWLGNTSTCPYVRFDI